MKHVIVEKNLKIKFYLLISNMLFIATLSGCGGDDDITNNFSSDGSPPLFPTVPAPVVPIVYPQAPAPTPYKKPHYIRMTVTELQTLSATEVSAISTVEISMLKNDQLGALIHRKEFNVGALTKTQIEGLTAAQINTLLPRAKKPSDLGYSTGFHYKELTENQLLSANDDLLDQYVPTIAKCCKVLPTGQKKSSDHKYEITTKSNDPYQTGGCTKVTTASGYLTTLTYSPVIDIRARLREHVDYNYHQPSNLGADNLVKPFFYYIPSKKKTASYSTLNGPTEDDNQYAARRVRDVFHLASSFSFSIYFTKIGQGGVSAVYKPLDQIEAYVTGLSSQVVKIRTLDLLGSYNDRDLANEAAQRDLALFEVIKQLADDYFVYEHGWRKNFIKVIPFQDFPRAKRRGIFIQAFSNGKTADKMAELVYQADHEKMSSAIAELNRLGFGDVETAKRRIALLEQFYKLTHMDMIHFNDDNGFPALSNGFGCFAPSGYLRIGIDYNRGFNVIWSIDDQSWHIIDF